MQTLLVRRLSAPEKGASRVVDCPKTEQDQLRRRRGRPPKVPAASVNGHDKQEHHTQRF
jgi:hypothetical protein